MLYSANFSAGKLYCIHCYGSVAGLRGYGHGALNESHVSGGAAGVTAGAEVITAPGIEGGVSGNANYSAVAPEPVRSGSGGAPRFCSNCGAAASGNFCAGCGNKLQ